MKLLQYDSDSEQLLNAVTFTRLVIEMVAQRAWSSSLHSETYPDGFAALYAASAEDRESALKHVKELWTAILEAEELCENPPDPQDRAPGQNAACIRKLHSLMTDLAFNAFTLNREFIAELIEAQWNPQDESLVYLAWGLFARPSNTKQFNEDVFCHLRHQESKHQKNKKVGRWSRYHMCVNTPSLQNPEAPGVQMVQVAEQDWQSPLEVPAHRVRDGIFVSAGHEPKPPIQVKDLLGAGVKDKPWKLSGPAANARSVAAARLLLADAPHKWINITKAWCGAHLRIPAATRCAQRVLARAFGLPRGLFKRVRCAITLFALVCTCFRKA